MQIEELYASPQIIQFTAGRWSINCLLATYGKYTPRNTNTVELEEKYFNESRSETKNPRVCRFTWPCKFKDIEQAAGTVYLHVTLTLSGSHTLADARSIFDFAIATYSELDEYCKNKNILNCKQHGIDAPPHTEMPYPNSIDDVVSKATRTHHSYQLRAGSTETTILPFIHFIPISTGVALQFHFGFDGFHAKTAAEIAARDALLENICDEFMSHVDISPLPLDERPRPTIKTAEDDGW